MKLEDIGQLFDSGVGSDFFGPQSSHPYLILDADDNDISAELAHWLAELPCVVCVIFNNKQRSDRLFYAADVVVDTPSDADYIAQNLTEFPIASLVLTQHLRLIENLDLNTAVLLLNSQAPTLRTTGKRLSYSPRLMMVFLKRLLKKDLNYFLMIYYLLARLMIRMHLGLIMLVQ